MNTKRYLGSTWKTPGLTLTPSSAASSVVHQLHQFGIDSLISFFQHFDQLSGLLKVSRGEEGVGSALVGATGCSANAVHIILGAIWIVIVDHKLDIFHIFQANSESVCRWTWQGKRR